MKILDHYKGLSRGVYIISASKLIQTLGAFIWPLFTLILANKIGLSAGVITIFMVFSMVGAVFSSLLGGYIADKIGPKKTILIFEIFAMLSFFSITLFDVGMITAYLLITGMMFFGIAGPAHEALMANVSKTEERESAFSLIYLAINLGVIVGPAVGGLLINNHFNLFITLDVVTTFIGWLLLMVFVKEEVKTDVMNELEEAIDEPLWKIIMKRPVILGFGVLSFFVAFTYGQLDFTLPLFIESLFTSSDNIFGFLPQFMIEFFDSSYKLFGILYSFNGLTVVLFTAVIVYFLRKISAMKKLLTGLILYILTLFAYAFIGTIPFLFLMMFVFTIGEIIISVGIGPILSKIVPTNILGKVSGGMAIFYLLGHLAATVIPGIMLDRGYEFKYIWLTVGFIGLFGLVYYFIFRAKFGSIIDKVDSFDKNRL